MTGRFTEKIGTYNPNTNPATVDLDFYRALYWVETGAQPTATAHNILKGEGVYLMKHLRGGVKKGVFDEATAQRSLTLGRLKEAQRLGIPYARTRLRLRQRLLLRSLRLRRSQWMRSLRR